MLNKKWLMAALNRALRTMCQSALSMIGVCKVLGEVNWVMVASASVLSGIISILTSMAGLPEVEEPTEDVK